MIRSFGDKTPKIHPTAFVSEAAYIVGDVEIGEGSSIWPGTVIRANRYKIKIGKFVNIQDNCVIHSDEDCTYGDYVTIGHNVMCHATAVEDHCLIGNGATVNGYSTIRHHSLIASGAVVLERVEIPPQFSCGGSARGGATPGNGTTSTAYGKIFDGLPRLQPGVQGGGTPGPGSGEVHRSQRIGRHSPAPISFALCCVHKSACSRRGILATSLAG